MSDQENDGKTTALAKIREAAALDTTEWADERILAIRSACVPKDATLHQIAIFLATASRYNLDPLLGEIWLVEDQGRMMVLTGRNAFLKLAASQDDFRGYESGVVYANDQFRLTRRGQEVEVEHQIEGFDRGQRIGGYCVARAEGRAPVVITRKWSDFAHLQTKKNWTRNPDDMIETRCITAALRRLYNLSGLIEPSEVGDAASDDRAASLAAQRATADVTAELRGKLADFQVKVPLPPPVRNVPAEPRAQVEIEDAEVEEEVIDAFEQGDAFEEEEVT